MSELMPRVEVDPGLNAYPNHVRYSAKQLGHVMLLTGVVTPDLVQATHITYTKEEFRSPYPVAATAPSEYLLSVPMLKKQAVQDGVWQKATLAAWLEQADGDKMVAMTQFFTAYALGLAAVRPHQKSPDILEKRQQIIEAASSAVGLVSAGLLAARLGASEYSGAVAFGGMVAGRLFGKHYANGVVHEQETWANHLANEFVCNPHTIQAMAGSVTIHYGQ